MPATMTPLLMRTPARLVPVTPKMRICGSVALIGVLLVFGLIVAGVLLIGGGVLLAVRQWKHSRAPAKSAAPNATHQPTVLEGEFVVIQQGRDDGGCAVLLHVVPLRLILRFSRDSSLLLCAAIGAAFRASRGRRASRGDPPR